MLDQPSKTTFAGFDPSEFEVACPNCGVRYRIATSLIGRRLSCRHCREVWRAAWANESLSIAELGTSSGRAGELPVAGTVRETQVLDTTWVGRRVGRFAVVSLLGRGGMGVVWRAHDDALKRDVALKILGRDSGHWSATALALFRQEARAAAQLQHPHVVTVHEVGEDDGSNYLAMELMHGGTLKEVVDRDGPMSQAELFSLLIGPARALALAHRRGMIHRDVKPGNLMFDDHRHLKLADFGLAYVNDDPASLHLRDRAVGSLGWVAPEVAGGAACTVASDIYSFGLCILFGLTGEPWIKADSRSRLLELHQSPPPLDFDRLPAMPEAARRLIRGCLAVDPAERFATADEIVVWLEQAMNAIRHAPPPAAAPPPPRHHRIRVAYLLTGLICGVLIAGISAALFARQYFDDIRSRMNTSTSRTVAPRDSSRTGGP